jgi:hypothetical protein
MQWHGQGGGLGAGRKAIACNSRNTKLPQLRFYALLDEDSTRQIALSRP